MCSAPLATDYVVIPLGADLFSLQGLKNLGPTLNRWRKRWQDRLNRWKKIAKTSSTDFSHFQLPGGNMQPIGYLCQQYSIRLERPVKAYEKWVNRIPMVYRESLLNETVNSSENMTPTEDPHCLATIKHYRSLIPMAQEHRKPIFNLTAADGAIGSHANAVHDAKKDFIELARKITERLQK